jgi:hypothetical protein
MSKVKIQGNASGTGVVTLTAPNTNTDRTITLPDGDITLGGGVDGIVSTANATAITIDSSENVGIGTNSPTVALQVEDTDYHQIYAKGKSTVGGIRLGNSVYDNGFIYYDNGANMLFNTNGAERMRIDSAGVMIWKANTAQRVPTVNTTEMVGDSGYGQTLRFNTSYAGTRQTVGFFYNGSSVGAINQTATSTVYATSSDYRLKENVVPMTGSIDRLKDLKPSRFNFKADTDKTVDGFLAHEAGEVVPECVSGIKDAMMDEEYEVTPAVMDGDTVVTEAVMGTRSVPDYQGIDQSKLVPLLVASLQEAIARIEQLENA